VIANIPQAEPGDAVLDGVDRKKLSVYTERLFRKLGIADASFHSLRHTTASWLVMEGVDLYTVGQLLGHRTPRMTQRYAHLSPRYLAGTMGKLDSVFGDVMSESASPATLLPRGDCRRAGEPQYVTIASPDSGSAESGCANPLN
jgi:hypothetical protein